MPVSDKLARFRYDIREPKPQKKPPVIEVAVLVDGKIAGNGGSRFTVRHGEMVSVIVTPKGYIIDRLREDNTGLPLAPWQREALTENITIEE